MNRETKNRLEFEFGKAFIEELNEVEPDSLIHDDNPDFFVGKQRFIGIELTQIHNETSKGHARAHVEGSWDNLMDKLKEIWDSNFFPGCHVELSFGEPVPIPDKKITQKAEEVVNLVIQYVPKLGSTFRSPHSMLINIPNLTGFTIERICNYESSLWSYFNSIWSPTLSAQFVQDTINKKEKKRKEYLMRCNQIWLVIALCGGRASGNFIIPKSTTGYTYENYFDRLFLFNCIPRKVFELNCKKNVK